MKLLNTSGFLVFPAEAGVNLSVLFICHGSVGIPRGGGGEPDELNERVDNVEYSPRRRG